MRLVLLLESFLVFLFFGGALLCLAFGFGWIENFNANLTHHLVCDRMLLIRMAFGAEMENKTLSNRRPVFHAQNLIYEWKKF